MCLIRYPFVRCSLGRYPPRYYKPERAAKMQISAISHPAPRLATFHRCTERTLSVPSPWHAAAFPRLVNSGLASPCNPSHLPIAFTVCKPSPQSRARHFRGKIRSPVSTVTYRQVRNSVARFEISTVTNGSSFSRPSSYLVFTPFPYLSAVTTICPDRKLLRFDWSPGIKSAFC